MFLDGLICDALPSVDLRLREDELSLGSSCLDFDLEKIVFEAGDLHVVILQDARVDLKLDVIDLEKEVGEPVSRLREKAGEIARIGCDVACGEGVAGRRRVGVSACCAPCLRLVLVFGHVAPPVATSGLFGCLPAFRPWEDCTLFAPMRMYVKADKLISFLLHGGCVEKTKKCPVSWTRGDLVRLYHRLHEETKR